MHKNMIKSNQSAVMTQKQSQHTKFQEPDTLHMGVAVALSSEDLEKELISKPIDTSTAKDGISTWILLSGGQNGKILPTEDTSTKSSIRYESKVEKVTKIRPSTTMKPKQKTTVSITANVDDKLKIIQQNNQVKSKKTTTIQPEVVTKKTINKKVTTVSSTPSSKVSITSAPSTTAVTMTTTPESNMEPALPTVESTTFLIMEPKDADFDLPQDRSPGTTKKPKKIKTKKNKTKMESKKPSKNQIANKDKPLSTKIYNYLAREVMPTVGVGLVGLTVAAGLATYFLAPFGALRRSYDDAADRKDDMYYYNNEEYAGPDGQLEEEAFGKVIAGMPINSPYRNSIRYTVQQQPSANQQLRQPNQIQNSRPGAKFVHYPAPSPQYRVRNVAPANYPSVVQQQYNSYQQQNHPSNSIYTKRREQYPQQFYRYSEEPSMGMYRKNSNYEFIQQQQQQQEQQQKQVHTSPPMQIDAQKSDDKTYEVDNSYNPTIVTAEPYFDHTMPGADMKIVDDNVLSKRTQFVVGTTVDDEKEQSQSPNEEIVKETVDVIPEHGPRRRRRDIHKRDQQISLSENEVDGIITDENEITPPTDVPITMNINLETDENFMKITTESSKNPDKTTLRPNIVDLFKELVEVKLRMGLSFLQKTTMAVQRYLKNIERRVEESKIFQSKSKSVEENKK